MVTGSRDKRKSSSELRNIVDLKNIKVACDKTSDTGVPYGNGRRTKWSTGNYVKE